MSESSLFVTALVFLFLRIYSKNLERKSAEKIVLYIMDNDVGEGISLLREMVLQPTPINELTQGFGAYIRGTTPWILYEYISPSTSTVDERTPKSTRMWAMRESFLGIHDRELYDLVRAWEAVFRRDVFTTLLLFGMYGCIIFVMYIGYYPM